MECAASNKFHYFERTTLVVPRTGVRWAELLETPLMLIASFWAARFILRRANPFEGLQCLAIGIFALGLLLFAEVSLILVQGMTLPEYIASRDPVSGTAYLISLVVFAAMPMLMRRGRGHISLEADRSYGRRP